MALGKLTPAELLKKNSSTGEHRIDILMNAIVKGIALPLVDGSELVLANSDENKSAVENFKVEGKTFNLKAKTGQRVIKSSDIGKSPLFGGGGGGARNSSDTTGVTGGNGGSGIVIIRYQFKTTDDTYGFFNI